MAEVRPPACNETECEFHASYEEVMGLMAQGTLPGDLEEIAELCLFVLNDDYIPAINVKLAMKVTIEELKKQFPFLAELTFPAEINDPVLREISTHTWYADYLRKYKKLCFDIKHAEDPAWARVVSEEPEENLLAREGGNHLGEKNV